MTSSNEQRQTLGTFAGVFTPSILTILGIILFLRLGYVVGHAGLKQALIIIGLANAISVLTSVSLSSIATNLKVKGGGDYYLISRTLGISFGGALGIVLFLAQSVSIAFYCIGFGEALDSMAPEVTWFSAQPIAFVAVSFLFIFAWLGADWATRLQYLIMGILAAALLSFFIGGVSHWNSAFLAEGWSTPASNPNFWILFAIFFPAVTGFTQGVSMSGDLKDPGKSLPLGTFSAVGLSIVVYFGAAVVFSASVSPRVLQSDFGAMKGVATFGFLIDAGIIGATLSSAMASFLGAPRILQSLAQDRVFQWLLPFAKGAGPSNNPRRGVLLSCVIAYATVGLGELNLIAPVVSMFFLISYGLLNYATFFEARTLSPSFRPRFRWFDMRLSLLGFFMCLAAMLAINLAAGIVAVAVLFAIYHYLKRTAGPARWADSSRSYHLQRVRDHLFSASAEPEHPRDWRPLLLALSNDAHRRRQLLRFASWIEGGSGMTTAVRILEGEGVKMLKAREEAEAKLKADIAKLHPQTFPLVLAAPNLETGIYTLVQAFGVGPIRANTVLLNWLGQYPKKLFEYRETRYGRNLRTAFRLGCNIVILDAEKTEWRTLEELPAEKRRIDIWWTGDTTGRLMLLLAYLMTRSDVWEDAKLRVICVCEDKDEKETVKDMEMILEEVRIDAEPYVVKTRDKQSICSCSNDAAMVFLPCRLGKKHLMDVFGVKVQELLTCLPVVALVLAAEDVELDAEPEEGTAGERAEALDAVVDAEKRAEKAEKTALEATAKAEEAQEEIREAVLSGEDEETTAKLAKEAKEAKEEAIKASRRAVKATVKAQDAEETAEALGVGPTKEEEDV
jgi:amino acid transporter